MMGYAGFGNDSATLFRMFGLVMIFFGAGVGTTAAGGGVSTSMVVFGPLPPGPPGKPSPPGPRPKGLLSPGPVLNVLWVGRLTLSVETVVGVVCGLLGSSKITRAIGTAECEPLLVWDKVLRTVAGARSGINSGGAKDNIVISKFCSSR